MWPSKASVISWLRLEGLSATQRLGLIVLLVVTIAVAVGSAAIGAVSIPPSVLAAWFADLIGLDIGVPISAMESSVLGIIRLPRIALGLLTGASLALAGATLQGIFRNPLADPGLIGVSSGAVVAVVGLIVFGAPLLDAVAEMLPVAGADLLTYVTPAAAFVGALLTVALVIRLSTRGGRIDMATMLLAGVAINALAGALIGFATYAADDKQLRSLTLWSLGSLAGASWQQVGLIAALTLPGGLWLLGQGHKLNLLLLGKSEAGHLGVQVDRLQRRAVAVAAFIVAVGVGFTGMIGFIGLVVPHVVRLIAGPDHRWVLPSSVMLGAALLSAADVLSRTVVAPAELPIGVVTALLGAPFFLWLLLEQRRRGGI